MDSKPDVEIPCSHGIPPTMEKYTLTFGLQKVGNGHEWKGAWKIKNRSLLISNNSILFIKF
jgi:hypothetical protein